MSIRRNWKLLQIFADGAAGGDGGSGGEASGESAADAGQQRLLELGVPRDRLPKAKAKNGTGKQTGASPYRSSGSLPQEGEASAGRQDAEQGKESADSGKGAETPSVAGARAGDSSPKGEAENALDWDAIVKHPDFNNRLQYMMRQRLGEEGSAKDKLAALGPVLQNLAKEKGVNLDVSDMMKLDPEDLALRLSHDKTFIREGAAEMGVDEDTFAEVTRIRDAEARRQREERQRKLQETFSKHISGLRAQGEALKGEYPDFDMDREMQNERFVHMTSPTGGMSVKEAYLALHGDEILQRKAADAAQQSREKLSAAIQANQARPRENGTGGPAAPVPGFNYKNMNPREKEAFRRRIQEAAYRGEKIYPGME